MGAGRLVCVFVPFALTVASIISLLVACLAGVTNKDMYNFKLNTTDFSISVDDIESLISSRSLPLSSIVERNLAELSGTPTRQLPSEASDLIASASAAVASATSASDAASSISSSISSTNITAEDLGLADAYYISIWNYCEHSNNGTTTCKKSKFDWATNATKSFENKFESVVNSTGSSASISKSLKSSMNTFSTVIKWTEICFIISFIALGATIIFGIFANCTRFFSCCATLVAAFAAVAVIASAGLATGAAAVVVGLAEGSAKKYGITGAFNTHFLAAVWLSAAFILAAVLFWMFSICCCAPDKGGRRRGGGRSKYADEAVPMAAAGPARGYSRIGEPEMSSANHTTGAYNAGGYDSGAYGGHGEAANYYGNNHNNNNGGAYENYRHHA